MYRGFADAAGESENGCCNLMPSLSHSSLFYTSAKRFMMPTTMLKLHVPITGTFDEFCLQGSGSAALRKDKLFFFNGFQLSAILSDRRRKLFNRKQLHAVCQPIPCAPKALQNEFHVPLKPPKGLLPPPPQGWMLRSDSRAFSKFGGKKPYGTAARVGPRALPDIGAAVGGLEAKEMMTLLPVDSIVDEAGEISATLLPDSVSNEETATGKDTPGLDSYSDTATGSSGMDAEGLLPILITQVLV